MRLFFVKHKPLLKKYRVWMRFDEKKSCYIVEAKSAKDAQDKAKAEYPNAKVGYAILVMK